VKPFESLEFAISDAAQGIAAGVVKVAQSRHDVPSALPLEHGLDVFHTVMEAKRVLAQHWRRAEAAWEKAETIARKVAQSKQQGIDARGVAPTARAAWRSAIALFEQVEGQEAAWDRIHAALDLFGPDGQLNDRCRAQAEIGAALEVLSGADWSKVRNFLKERRSLAFLDRMHRRLEQAEPRRSWREGWWLRHRRVRPADLRMSLVQAVACDRELDEEECASYGRVAVVLGDTFRASSAVECMNSVLRMQQSRHRRMTQPMLDLKQLYWNTRSFRCGPRKNVCPYLKLGLQLPTYDFWELLTIDPAQLTQQLSTQGNAE